MGVIDPHRRRYSFKDDGRSSRALVDKEPSPQSVILDDTTYDAVGVCVDTVLFFSGRRIGSNLCH